MRVITRRGHAHGAGGYYGVILDLARVRTVDIGLPIEETLSFFDFDGQLDDGEAVVLADDRESWTGACVLYMPAEEKHCERDAPLASSRTPRFPSPPGRA